MDDADGSALHHLLLLVAVLHNHRHAERILHPETVQAFLPAARILFAGMADDGAALAENVAGDTLVNR